MAAEYELRIVESMHGLGGGDAAPPTRPRSRSAVLTAERALELLRAANGGAAVIESAPAFSDLRLWRNVGSYSVQGNTGIAAYDGPWIFGATIGGAENQPLGMEALWRNDFAYFAGPGESVSHFLDGDPPPVIAPTVAEGLVCCPLWAEEGGYYLFYVSVETDATGDANVPPSRVEAKIDETVIGTVSVAEDNAVTVPFVTNLGPGYHQFWLRQVDNSFRFQGVSVWNIPAQHVVG
jgi:hypothetical protein